MHQQQLFSQINDFSSGNDGENNFESFDIKSHSATRHGAKPEVEKKKAEQLLMTRSSEALENQLNEKKKSSGGLEIIGHKRAQRGWWESSTINPDPRTGTTLSKTKSTMKTKRKMKNGAVDDLGTQDSLSQEILQEDEPLPLFQLESIDKKAREEEPRDFVKVKKKINFHVIVKNTKMYEALKFMDKKRKLRNAREALKNDAEDGSKGPISIFSSEGGLALHDLSSFVQTKDPSILMFSLYCA
eukprot:CAMPEP_0170510546 /NCGR_PEP_ID=MMETSP0208-20121228/65826_1 /TAXON_ID=197538 /ORGANISM="Strombidium inclinatum, Strain S3" /LENGTH=242 /DNA_ID=CAMNT_0010794017 /DNA_START=1038 /DNA_END=1769 /DNA_ORIENTATION=+